MTASRSTFRDPAGDVAYQRQLRDRYAAEGVPSGVPHLDVGRAIVRPVSRRLAEQIILKYEWLGTMATTGHHLGLFFGSFCAGVCCVSIGGGSAGVNVSRSFGVEPSELAVLARGACVHWAPSGSNSKLIAWTARIISRKTTARLMIAYADDDAGEIGTIYQACGWAYIGVGGATSQFVAPNGRVYDQKLGYDLRRKNGTLRTIRRRDQEAALLAAGWHLQRSNPKHRYVCVLDRSDLALIERVESMRQPYPKRVRSIRADAPVDQTGEGGAAPTRTLQVAH